MCPLLSLNFIFQFLESQTLFIMPGDIVVLGLDDSPFSEEAFDCKSWFLNLTPLAAFCWAQLGSLTVLGKKCKKAARDVRFKSGLSFRGCQMYFHFAFTDIAKWFPISESYYWYNMIIRCYRLNARPCFVFFVCYFLFLFFFGGGGGVPKNKKTSICIMDLHNLQQLWISIIALWVNMFARLWISICSVLAVHYGYPWYNYGYP